MPSTPAPAAAPSTPAAPAPAGNTQPQVPATPSTPTPAGASTAPTQEGQGGGNNNSSFISGEALQTAISSMTEMGFEREQVMKALRASFNNPERAVEYLMTVSRRPMSTHINEGGERS